MPLDNRTCFLVNLRDALTCQACGKQPTEAAHYHRGFEYHHILPKHAGGADAVGNLILLCHACHRLHHGKEAVISPPFGADAPETFSCAQCGETIASHTVQMNCGWYACPACETQVSLFHHFIAPEALD